MNKTSTIGYTKKKDESNFVYSKNYLYQLMILYEYIDQLVHVDLLLTMEHLIIVLNDYEVIQVLYFDARSKREFIQILEYSKRKKQVFNIHKAFHESLPDFHHYL